MTDPDQPARWSAAPIHRELDDSATQVGMADVLIAGESRAWSGTLYTTSTVGRRLRYVSHQVTRDDNWHTLAIRQQDSETGLITISELRLHDTVAAVSCHTIVCNDGPAAVTLHAVSSMVFSGFGCRTGDAIGAYTLTRGQNTWLAEGRWHDEPLNTVVPTLATDGRPVQTRSAVRAVSTGSASTADELPAAFLTHEDGAAWGWQVEHNGAWTWQLQGSHDGLHLALLGPTDEEHQFSCTLAPGETFASVPATLAFGDHGFASAVAALTAWRRVSRLTVDTDLPLVFNDYMNTLMADPTTDRLLPLIDAAAEAGAEYFCIDAGWYDDTSTWWDAVGEWMPSSRRFPGGLDELLDRIRDRGMVPGLWLEPEVIGVNSLMFDRLPAEAFMQRNGRPTVEHGRYHLDFAHPAARAHVDGVVDRLVAQHGIGYLKLDYNIRTGAGTDTAGRAAGAGLLGHNRAMLDWLDGIRIRHPQLVIENCASGAMRSDHAMLSRTHLQSTSDQEDAVLYAPIAVSAPLMMLPEQSGNWAYPADWMSRELTVLTLVNGLAGRLYLSGFLYRLPEHHRTLVADAAAAYKVTRATLARALPFWPLGLPRWSDAWLALGLRAADGSHALLYVWHRPGQGAANIKLTLPGDVRWKSLEALFPGDIGGWTAELTGSELALSAPITEASARVFRLTA
ncbi:glycoside hydrolase family 36 protein [Hamadaea tsunoensis]|uniref:glycoside hydrolase family 36 protein n=1 Tax=Hamadaea tsunoensis TaxID=53368 RepID=UPI000686BF80|nr:glycoside hydrolase family 36 protein [Hamadaea tsunoensis]